MRSSVTDGLSLFRRGRLERHRVPGDLSDSARYHSWVRSYHPKAGLGQSPRCARGRIHLVRSRAECDKNKVCRQIATSSDSSGWASWAATWPSISPSTASPFWFSIATPKRRRRSGGEGGRRSDEGGFS